MNFWFSADAPRCLQDQLEATRAVVKAINTKAQKLRLNTLDSHMSVGCQLVAYVAKPWKNNAAHPMMLNLKAAVLETSYSQIGLDKVMGADA